MSIEVEITEVQPRKAAVLDIKTTYDKISESMGEGYEKLFGYLGRTGVQPAGPPFALYMDVSGPEWDIRLGAPVAGMVSEGEGVKMGELPGGKVAATWHVGPYDKLGETWTALEAWLKEHDYETSGMCWESYVTDPDTEPDSSKWKTQIVWAVEQ